MNYEDLLVFNKDDGMYVDDKYGYPISRTPSIGQVFDPNATVNPTPDPLRTSTIISTTNNLTLRPGSTTGSWIAAHGTWNATAEHLSRRSTNRIIVSNLTPSYATPSRPIR